MSAGAPRPSSSRPGKEREDGADEGNRKEGEEGDAEGDMEMDLYGASAGWVEARTNCPHLSSMPAADADDLTRVPPPDSPCSRFRNYLHYIMAVCKYNLRVSFTHGLIGVCGNYESNGRPMLQLTPTRLG